MRLLYLMSVFMILLVSTTQAEELQTPVGADVRAIRIAKLHQDIVVLSQQIWAQLSAISNKQDAEAAADEFAEKASRLTALDQELQALEQDENLDETDQAMMDELAPHVIDSYVMLGSEFTAIYNNQCLDSPKLKASFELALRGGFFFVSHSSDKPLDLPALNDEEATQELSRIRQLLEPDRLAHLYLSRVTNASTAKIAAGQLLEPIARLHKLRPVAEQGMRPFPNGGQQQYLELVVPIEKSLWGIRSEYVRLAATFAPDSEDYNTLANTLDELYLSLEETHTRLFTSVFDESFLQDMDDAYDSHGETAQNNTFSTQP